MPSTGYGGSVVGNALGTFPNIESVIIEGLEAAVKVVRCITDTDRIGTRLPTTLDEGNAQVKMVYDATTKTLYGTLRTYAGANTQDTFTITDSIGNTHVGLGRIAKVGAVPMEVSDEMTFDVTIAPVTKWTYTAAA